jgi:hypothetical protein
MILGADIAKDYAAGARYLASAEALGSSRANA